jgi:site-specific DNA-cytosine methylase
VLVLHTSGKTAENIKFFNNVKEKNTKKPIVLLELFAGIGGGIVALKNIGVAIRAVVTVEHDPAAFFVYKSNHYDKNDRITFIHKEKFEDLSLDEILLSLGRKYITRQYQNFIYWLSILFSNFLFDFSFTPAIDFVIGGPPCVDFSGVNATRQGIEGFQGSYMMKFASLVHDLKNHTLQNQNPLFFLCENVPISMDCGLLEIEEKFQVVGVTLDAKYLSPCKRNRMYFTNVSPFLFALKR